MATITNRTSGIEIDFSGAVTYIKHSNLKLLKRGTSLNIYDDSDNDGNQRGQVYMTIPHSEVTSPVTANIDELYQTVRGYIDVSDNSGAYAKTGYSQTGAFAGKPLSNNYVWEAGEGISYTQTDVDNGTYKVLSLDNDVHLAVDNPYWTTPDVSGLPNVGLFNGYALPNEVTSLVDYTYDFDTEYPSSTGTGFEGSTGRIRLNDLQYGDQLRVRFDFNVIPQIANTTIEPALWYSNRDDSNNITFTFPLTTSPVFYGGGTVGNTFLNRVDISAWIISNEDVNALTLPAIKADNPIIIQPLGLLITVLR